MATKRAHKVKRKRAAVAASSLAEMSVEDFMAGFEGESDEENSEVKQGVGPKKRKRQRQSGKVQSHTNSLTLLEQTDPEFYKFLQENDEQLLAFSRDEGIDVEGVGGVRSGGSDGVESELDEESDNVSEDSDTGGLVEPRPAHVTSRRETFVDSDNESSVSSDSDVDSGGGEGCEARVPVGGKSLKPAVIHKWVLSIEESHSLNALKQLTQALHFAIAQMLDNDPADTKPTYQIESASVFNLLVVSCLTHVEPCLTHHIPLTEGRSSKASAHKAWSRVKRILKPHLTDLNSLMTSLRDPAMQCAVIKSVQSLARFTVCLPKVCRGLEKRLIECWSSGDSHVQIVAFMTVRELTLLKPHPSLSEILKKLYMAFVRNCKFTTSESLSRVRFMGNCLLELLSMDTPTTYQLGFVYIRQLAIHLRAAITSGKKDSQQTVYNWQFVHCLELWARVLGHVTDSSLRPLVYPLVQVIIGTVTLQPSPRYYPLRLHLVRTLIELGRSTDTFIPTAPYLLEVLERCGTNVSSRLQTGKPPDLSLLLRATKAHLQSRSYQSAVLNCCFEQLLMFSAAHSHLIGYPELMFPVTTRIRKVAKETKYSWLRLQLQQLLAKVNEVVTATERDREKVDFSPSQTSKVNAWEAVRKSQENAIRKFAMTWSNAHSTKVPAEVGGAKNKLHPPSDKELSDVDSDDVMTGNDDVIEDFDLSSADSD